MYDLLPLKSAFISQNFNQGCQFSEFFRNSEFFDKERDFPKISEKKLCSDFFSATRDLTLHVFQKSFSEFFPDFSVYSDFISFCLLRIFTSLDFRFLGYFHRCWIFSVYSDFIFLSANSQCIRHWTLSNPIILLAISIPIFRISEISR